MPLRIVDLLAELEHRVGSKQRLASRLHVSPRIVSDWLHGKTQRMRPDNHERIRDLARELDIDTNSFDSESLRLWDPHVSYKLNLQSGPIVPNELSGTNFAPHPRNFLGKRLNSPFGAAASVLTCTPDRVGALFKTGCDLVTYKTVQSRNSSPIDYPNIFYVSPGQKPLDVRFAEKAKNLEVEVEDASLVFASLSMVNRFGVPSESPESWKADYRRAKSYASDGQLLILSVLGNAGDNPTPRELVKDFLETVRHGVEAGAEVIELNSSCPNRRSKGGLLYHDVALVRDIVKKIRSEASKEVRLLLKIGYMRDDELRRLLHETAEYIEGISAINAVAVTARRPNQMRRGSA